MQSTGQTTLAGRCRNLHVVDNDRVITAAELDAMTPTERQTAFEAATMTDLSEVPKHILQRVRATVAARAQQQ